MPLAPTRFRVPLLTLALTALTVLTPSAPAQATPPEAASALSAASALPAAVVLSATGAALSAGAELSVAAVKVSADGTEWVLERASDGTRLALMVAGQTTLAVGAAVTLSAVTGGWLISSAGQALAWLPDRQGRALSHHERVRP